MNEQEWCQRMQAGGDYLECEAIWIETGLREVEDALTAPEVKRWRSWWRRILGA